MEPNEKTRIRYTGLNIWTIVLTAIFIVCGITLFMYNIMVGIIVEVIAAFCMVFSILMAVREKVAVERVVYELNMSSDTIQSHLLSKMKLPYTIVNQRGDIIWMNDAFEAIAQKNKRLMDVFPDLDQKNIESAMNEEGVVTVCNNTSFRVISENLKSYDEGSSLVKDFMGNDVLWGLSFYDETELIMTRRELSNQKNMVCLLYLDNYEEVLENVEQVRQSVLTALIERRIGRYFQQYNALLRKQEKDKYLAVIKQKHIGELKETKFSILEEVKGVNIGNSQAITVSIGLGMGGDEYSKNFEYARVAVEMALARGGDQAVVKDGSRIQYFGGKSQKAERATRVKARMKAHALTELVRTHDEIFIMGHRLGDIDCIGAGIGMYRVMDALGKKSHIVINDVIASVKPFYDRFKGSEYPEDLFINSEEALKLLTDDTVLVVVDTNRRSIVEEKELIDWAKTIVVLDHHRQVQDYIANAVLSYVEPNASSACEMVAEILQYVADGDIKLKPCEADAIYAGIVLDTHNFTAQTGVRTFEAAAYLRNSGADITNVRKLFRDDLEAYKVKAEAIHNMEIIYDRFALAVCGACGENQTVIAAETANDLLSISEIQASFVLTKFEDNIFISARSIDEVNVQVIMEKLGGGGHMSIAGAQLKGAAIEDAKELVKETIGFMIEEGEI